HFDIRDTLLWNMMPLGISEMKSLQILSNKIVVENNSFISWLKNLKNLQGNISIQGLDKVQTARDIREVNLSQKRVSELHLIWSNEFNDARNEKLENEVMNALKPHRDNLQDLSIGIGITFNGTRTPHLHPASRFLELPKDSRSTRNVVAFTFDFEYMGVPR
nr:NB-ARC domains-containing protein [Tanacetum cinerariifolium]